MCVCVCVCVCALVSVCFVNVTLSILIKPQNYLLNEAGDVFSPCVRNGKVQQDINVKQF